MWISRPLRGTAPAALVTLLLSPASSAEVLVVAPDGTGDHPTIQAALDAAGDGDVVELLDGVFAGPGNRDLDPGGTAVVLRSRSGTASSCVIDCEGAGRGLVFQNGKDTGTRVENLTIRGGVDESADPRGGAVFIGEGTSPALVGCEIRDSHAWAPIPDFGRGGGIFCDAGSSPTIEGCVVTGCWSIRGGGINTEPGSAALIRDCVLVENEARGAFSGGRGGGAYLAGASRIEASTVTDNRVRAGSHGPGLGGGLVLAGTARTEACEIRGNDGVSSSCCPTWGGGVFIAEEASANIVSSLVAGNMAARGGGVGAWGSASVEGTTIAHNGDGATGGVGVLLEGASQQLLLERSIVWGNCDAELVANEGSIVGSCVAVGPASVSGNVTLPPDLVDEDPRFCDPGTCAATPFTFGHYALEPGSPCAATSSPCGERIGYLGVGCSATPVERLSWGRLKERF